MSIKKVVVGVTGGIAAYKSAYLVRGLKKQGIEVRVIMTPASKQFIGPLTLSTLSKNSVLSEFQTDDGNWNDHVELGRWADLLIIAPATANTIGKMANGLCDNLLLAVYLSAKCPVAIAPAMDLDMYAHPSVKQNLRILKESGVYQIGPEAGELASGLEGPGRMTEPEKIISTLLEHYGQ